MIVNGARYSGIVATCCQLPAISPPKNHPLLNGAPNRTLTLAGKDRALAEAPGRQALITPESEISAAMGSFKVTTQRIKALPAIIREMVAPAQYVNSIRVQQVTGLGGAPAPAQPIRPPKPRQEARSIRSMVPWRK